MILCRENVERITDDPIEIERFKSEGYIEVVVENVEAPKPKTTRKRKVEVVE